jgi:hypothetical protein
MHTCAGVKIYARLPHRPALAALGDEARVKRLYEDLGALVPVDGWLLEDVEPPAGPMHLDGPPPLFEHRAGIPPDWSAWVVRERRQPALEALGRAEGPDALGWRAFAALDAARPGLALLWLAPRPGAADPHPLAEISLVPRSLDGPIADDRMAMVDSRLLSWFTGATPPDARQLARQAVDVQRRGGVSLGWCPDDPVADRPEAAIAAPGVSASIFPVRR